MPTADLETIKNLGHVKITYKDGSTRTIAGGGYADDEEGKEALESDLKSYQDALDQGLSIEKL